MQVLAKLIINKIYLTKLRHFVYVSWTKWFWLWTGWTANKSNGTETSL